MSTATHTPATRRPPSTAIRLEPAHGIRIEEHVPKLLVPLRDFEAPYEGRTEAFTRSMRLAPDHEIARRFPDRFAPHGSAKATQAQRAWNAERLEARSKTAAKPRPARKPAPRRRSNVGPFPKWHLPREDDELPVPAWSIGGGGAPLTSGLRCKLQAEESPYEVRVGLGVGEAIQRTIAATPAGFETGGVLIGAQPPADGKLLRLTDAGGPTADAIRRRSSFRPNWTAMLAEGQRASDASGGAIGPAGMWHVHPERGGKTNLIPSGADVGCFGALFERCADMALTRVFAALIVSESGRIAAYTVRREHSLTGPVLICEPARAVIR